MNYLEFDNIRESNYSLGSKVVNTALTGASLMGFSPAKRMLRKRAMKFAMNKASDGASGVIAAKTGIDKGSVKNLMDGIGGMTGATKGIQKIGVQGSIDNTALGRVAQSASDRAKDLRLKIQRGFGTGPQNTSTS